MKMLKALFSLLMKDLARKSTISPRISHNIHIIILDEGVEGVELVADEGLDKEIHHLPQEQP
jgi:ABC-type Na+ transport system ATPase subunit NatA